MASSLPVLVCVVFVVREVRVLAFVVREVRVLMFVVRQVKVVRVLVFVVRVMRAEKAMILPALRTLAAWAR
jgi:hypothetical protein